MKKTVVNQWDPGKGNYYPHQLDKEGLKSYDIRYTLHGVKFKGTLREQPHGARYAYRAEITAISPLTGKVVTDSKGNVVVRSFWSNEVDLNRLLNAIAKAAEKLYADNAVALSRAVEENVVFRPETTTPLLRPSALPRAMRTRSPPRLKRRRVHAPSTTGKRLSSKRSSHNCRRSLCAKLNPWKSVGSFHHGNYRSAITSSFAAFGIGA